MGRPLRAHTTREACRRHTGPGVSLGPASSQKRNPINGKATTPTIQATFLPVETLL